LKKIIIKIPISIILPYKYNIKGFSMRVATQPNIAYQQDAQERRVIETSRQTFEEDILLRRALEASQQSFEEEAQLRRVLEESRKAFEEEEKLRKAREDAKRERDRIRKLFIGSDTIPMEVSVIRNSGNIIGASNKCFVISVYQQLVRRGINPRASSVEDFWRQNFSCIDAHSMFDTDNYEHRQALRRFIDKFSVGVRVYHAKNHEGKVYINLSVMHYNYAPRDDAITLNIASYGYHFESITERDL
jgi:hypothetical protein